LQPLLRREELGRTTKMSEAITRREFVAAATSIGAAAAIAGAAGCTDAGSAPKAAVETPTTSYGGDSTMNRRILVGYATRNGSTVGVAQAIGETLGARGYAVDVKPLKDGPSLEGYNAVVLGSAINGARWLPEALGFVRANEAALGAVPLAVFCVHAMNCGSDAKETKKRQAYLDQVRALVHPAHEAYFPGRGPTAQDTSASMLWLYRTFGGDIEGDGRDWTAIRAWAHELAV
jgi:menaquinone-dependent protoporphyrinogen oxidase